MKRLILVLLILPIILGCATPAIKPEKLSSIKQIGAVSLLGPELCNNYLGTTVFTKKRFSSNVATWNIDNMVQQEISNIISADGRYNYVDLPIDHNSKKKKGTVLLNGFFRHKK